MTEGLYLLHLSSLQECQAFFALDIPVIVMLFCNKNSAVSMHVTKLSVVTPLPDPNNSYIKSNTMQCPKFFSGAFPGSFSVLKLASCMNMKSSYLQPTRPWF